MYIQSSPQFYKFYLDLFLHLIPFSLYPTPFIGLFISDSSPRWNIMLFCGLPTSHFFPPLFPTQVPFLLSMSNTADVHVPPLLSKSQWLPIYWRIMCKLLIMAHKAFKNIPTHLSSHSSSWPLMNLWSSHSTFLPIFLASHHFPASVPFLMLLLWNAMPFPDSRSDISSSSRYSLIPPLPPFPIHQGK